MVNKKILGVLYG